MNAQVSNNKYGYTPNNQECLIDAARQREIDNNVPETMRTTAWFISCPCKKCSPFSL